MFVPFPAYSNERSSLVREFVNYGQFFYNIGQWSQPLELISPSLFCKLDRLITVNHFPRTLKWYSLLKRVEKYYFQEKKNLDENSLGLMSQNFLWL